MRPDRHDLGYMGLLIFVLVMAIAGNPSEAPANDPYAENIAKASIAGADSPVYAFTEKALNRLGDRAAIGIIRVLGEKTDLNPGEIKRVLELVQMAFAAPKVIESSADREPKATLLLLRYLQTLPESKPLLSNILETRAFVLHASGTRSTPYVGQE